METLNRSGTPLSLGLTREQLLPIAEEAAGEFVRTFDIHALHEIQGPYGVHGRKLIPTLSYTTTAGRTGTTTIFIKQREEVPPGHMEAHHYRFLGAHGAPVPRLYGALTDGHHRETLFLEYVDAVTDREPCREFLNDALRFPKFLTTIAHLNAIQPSEAYLAQLLMDVAARPGPPGWDWRRRIRYGLDQLSRIRQAAQAGTLGSPLQDLCTARVRELDLLAETAQLLPARIDAMPKALCLSDCYPHCTGWRRTTGELLVFDLEYVGMEARFWDIAPWLGAPDTVQPRCGPREQLADVYLAKYNALRGSQVQRGPLLQETRVLWFAWILVVQLGWYFALAGTTTMPPPSHVSPEDKLAARTWLLAEITTLLDHAGKL